MMQQFPWRQSLIYDDVRMTINKYNAWEGYESDVFF